MTLMVPERMLVFSPALAATIGLEEAVLLHVLHDLSVCQPKRHAQHLHETDAATLEQLLPFWDRRELQRISKNLADKGVLHIESAPLTHANTLCYRFQAEEAPAAPARSTARTAQTRDGSASLLANNWRPEEDLLQLLALNHNISRAFSLAQLEDFILYWRERGEVNHAWGSRFRQHVLRQWRLQEQADATPTPTALRAAQDLENSWYPSPDALQILERANVSREFIDDAVPEFVLYWRERGTSDGTWNSKFIAHIRRQWSRYENALEHEQDPRPITTSWQPNEDVYDILRMANIDIAFACEMLPEFILFWRDAGTPHRSWNTKFLQHVKYQWATRHHLAGVNRAGSAIATGAASATPSNAFERLTDRSWAAGLIDGV
ncbi:MAG: hypothetical protein JWM78_1425 [Verrucomicrobiaceae bacterium]|nr:hypothetical protein [Verrucomicrobiaceae bacterium]